MTGSSRRSSRGGRGAGARPEAGGADSLRIAFAEALAELAVTRTELDGTRADFDSRREELRSACRELEASRDRFQDLHDLSPHGSLTLDREGRVLEANLAAAELLGVTREALLRRRLAGFIEGSQRPLLARHLGECLERGGPASADLRLRRADGRTVQALVQSRRVEQDETGSTCRMTLSDNTERWEAAEALRRSEERYRELADSVADPFFALDEQLTCTYWNPAAERLTGIAAASAVGRPLPALGLRPGSAARVDRAFRRVQRTHRPETLLVSQLAAAEGEERSLELRVYCSRNGVCVFGRDVTDLVAREAERARLLEELAAAREEAERRAAEADEGRGRLGEALRELERSKRDLDRFTGIASHALRGPLHAIAADAREGAGGSRDGEVAARITANAGLMEELLDGLEEYLRLDARPPTPGPVDLGRALERALRAREGFLREHGALVTRDPLPVVSADEGEMVRLLELLLANAVRFRRGSRVRIHVSAESTGGETVVSVGDDGVGLAPRRLERMLRGAEWGRGAAASRGAAVGLAVCKRIVDRHGGRFWVESPPEGGARYRFAIPRG